MHLTLLSFALIIIFICYPDRVSKENQAKIKETICLGDHFEDKIKNFIFIL